MIVWYHPETNENIYTYTNEQPKPTPTYEPPKRKPVVAQDSTNEQEVRLDKENKLQNQEEVTKKAPVPWEKG